MDLIFQDFLSDKTMTLTQEELAIIGHVVIDPNAWVAHALETVGESAVIEKIARYRAAYLAEKERLGDAYKNRVERETQR